MNDDELFRAEPVDAPPRLAEANDMDAPYGRKADGTPYKRRPNGAGGGRSKTATTSTRVNKTKAVTDVVSQFYGAIVGILTVLARIFKSTPLMADAIVTSEAAPKVIPPLTQVVSQNADLVEMCVRLSKVTPAVELLTVLMPLIGQIATNHSLVPGAENQSERIVKAYQEKHEAEKAHHAEPTPEEWVS